ncbi:MAG: serine hydrolase [Bacteroidota bacterium]
MKRKLVYFGIPLLILFSIYLYALPLLETGTGYAAKMMCSCLYVHNTESSLETMQAERLNFSVLSQISLQHDAEEKSVHTSFYGLAGQEAKFIPGRGCVMVADQNKPLPAGIEVAPPPLSQVASDLSLQPDSTTMAGVDLNKLAEAIDFGMAPVPGGGAHAIVVLRNGQLLTERYAEGITADARLLGWSMTKSITAGLLGMRVASGDIDLNKRPVFTEWQGTAEQPDPRETISLTNLLRMNSGLRWNEAYGSVSDATIMLHDQVSMANYVMKQPLAEPPATHWMYSSGTTNLLMEKVARSFVDKEALIRWIHDSLFYPIGANSFIIETDQRGLPVGSSYGWARARDWAKMGQLYLQNGRWGDRQIIPAAWIDYIRQPAEDSEGIYGGQIWLPGPDMPSLPQDAFMFRGFQDQRVFMIPSKQLVIVRLGHNVDKATDFDGLVARVLAAVS